MNYQVTGGTGFVGSYIVKRLLDEKHTIVAYDFQPDATSAGSRGADADELSHVNIVNGDVTDLDQLLRVCEEHKVERLIHMAGILQAETTGKVHNALKTNCAGTTNVFEAARRLNIPRVVWASSTAVFATAKDYPYEFLPNDAHTTRCPSMGNANHSVNSSLISTSGRMALTALAALPRGLRPGPAARRRAVCQRGDQQAGARPEGRSHLLSQSPQLALSG